jgi:hypothetical protein
MQYILLKTKEFIISGTDTDMEYFNLIHQKTEIWRDHLMYMTSIVFEMFHFLTMNASNEAKYDFTKEFTDIYKDILQTLVNII